MIVIFDYDEWVARYPEFIGILEPQATMLFNEAELFCDNTEQSIVPYDTSTTPPAITRKTLLYMLTAHLAYIYGGQNGTSSGGMIGRVSSASEGSVSASSEYPMTIGSAWYNQSRYGAAYWQATAQWRTMHYMNQPSRFGHQPLPAPAE